MKKVLQLILALTLISNLTSAQTFRLLNGDAVINPYYDTTKHLKLVTKKVGFTIRPASAVNSDTSISFKLDLNSITSIANAPTLVTTSYPISKAKWNEAFKGLNEISDSLSLTIPFSRDTLSAEQVALIFANGSLNGSDRIILHIKNPDLPRTRKVNQTPNGFTYLNAVNFDFGNTNSSSYVGHLNVFKPELATLWDIKNKYRDRIFKNFGINCGIMKIDYSQRGDSSNISYNYTENTLINPLDSVKIGTPYYRQYNKLTTTTKNTTNSFYFQPMISLIHTSKVRLMFHLHAELFVNSYTSVTTIKNLQQLTDTMRTNNISLLADSIINHVNKFGHALTDDFNSTTSTTKLSFNAGFGLTYHQKLWTNGYLFVQPTYGICTNYATPTGFNSKSSTLNENNDKVWFHLTKLELTQEISSNVQAIIGVIVRGKFTQEPTYASYIGINVGLDGISALLK